MDPSEATRVSTDAIPARTIYRGRLPERKPLTWLGVGLTATCVVGLYLRGPEPAILAALLLSPIAVLAYYIFVLWGSGRIMRVDLADDRLMLHPGLGKPRQVRLSDLQMWALKDIAAYSTGGSYNAAFDDQAETGLIIRSPALVARDRETGDQIALFVDGATFDLAVFRAFAPTATEQLERHRRRA